MRNAESLPGQSQRLRHIPFWAQGVSWWSGWQAKQQEHPSTQTAPRSTKFIALGITLPTHAQVPFPRSERLGGLGGMRHHQRNVASSHSLIWPLMQQKLQPWKKKKKGVHYSIHCIVKNPQTTTTKKPNLNQILRVNSSPNSAKEVIRNKQGALIFISTVKNTRTLQKTKSFALISKY